MAMGYTPFYIEYGRHPYKGIEKPKETNNPAVEEFVENITKIRENAKKALERASTKIKKAYGKYKSASRNYKEGDMVWLEGKHIKTK